ncbi:DUF4129 domain-containing transglutaminase family protein [Paenibacillus sp. IHBB 10380]|uniref:DUF4129 domain-containing transglutaminase family protein n=1 Tax=Paenibacillus sp. IHBB 10380 TaxID=1566358 RepID=UPI000695CFFC|nr:transglutaminase domain-containing protein [Paenibacillus sp. IHBB 10380]
MQIPIQNQSQHKNNVHYDSLSLNVEETAHSNLTQIKTHPLLFRVVLSIILMGLFIEWLYPLSERSFGKPLLEIFIGLTGMILLTGLIRLHMALSILIHVILVMGAWILYFGRGEGVAWFGSYITIFENDFKSFMDSGQLSVVGTETHTLILMIGWSVLVTSVQSLALYRNSVWIFSVVTVVYLLCIENLLGLEIYADMIRTTCLLIILQGLIFSSKLTEKATFDRFSNLTYSRWVVAVCTLGVIVCMSSVWVGRYMVSPKPLERVSIQALLEKWQSWSGERFNASQEQVAVTGYSSGGEELGSPLQPVSKMVFTAQTPMASYWRGETLSYYNGRRWADPQVLLDTVQLSSRIQSLSSSQHTGQPTIIQTVQFKQVMSDHSPIFGGGDIVHIMDIITKQGDTLTHVLHNGITDNVKLPESIAKKTAHLENAVTGYRIEVMPLIVNKDQLRAAIGIDPEQITQSYLQLPDALPSRIKTLSDRITSETDNRYDAALAIQTYLKEQYKYAMNTKIPPANADFVEDFLFVTKQGYCNHFATAMTIMLRSQGIPARYVKGYTQGTLKEGSTSTYVVDEINAHAWVEVYFPERGWTPFDPTPGFNIATSDTAVSEMVDPKNTIQEVTWKYFSGTMNVIKQSMDKLTRYVDQNGRLFILQCIGAVIFVSGSVFLIWRGPRYLFLWRLQHLSRSFSPPKGQLLRVAYSVWDQIGRRYGYMAKGTTAQEYIQYMVISDEDLREQIRQFVDQWETIAYGGTILSREHSLSFLRRCAQLADTLG